MTDVQSGITEASLVSLHRDLPDKSAVLELLAQTFTGAGRAAEREGILADLLSREEEISTAMGFGFAIPHAKSGVANRASVAYVGLEQPIQWSGEEVSQVLSIIVPEGGADDHLKILAELARKLVDEEFRERLSAAATAEEVVDLLDV